MNRQTLAILVIALILVGLLLILEKPFKRETPKPRRGEQVELVAPLSEEECSRIVLSGGLGTTVTLVRKDREWFTGDGYKADPNAITQLFEGLENFGEPELVSINPNAFMKFRVDSFLGTRLRMFDMAGEPKVDLIIGQFERDFFHTPVRKPDSKNVYRVRARMTGIVRRPSWRDHNIFRFDQASLRRIAVQRADESYVVTRDEATNTWRFSEPTSGPVEERMTQMWVQQIASLRAADFEPSTDADMLTTFGLADPREQVAVTLDDGSSYTVVFGNFDPKRKQHYVKRLDEPQVYRVPEHTHIGILKKSADLQPKPKPTPPPLPTPSPTTPTVTTAPAPVTTPTEASTVPSSPTAPTERLVEPAPKGDAAAPPDRPGDTPTSDKPTTSSASNESGGSRFSRQPASAVNTVDFVQTA